MKPLPMTAAPTSLSARPVKRLLLAARMVNGTVNHRAGRIGDGSRPRLRIRPWRAIRGSAAAGLGLADPSFPGHEGACRGHALRDHRHPAAQQRPDQWRRRPRLVLLLYGTGYFFASRPQHEALALAGAKDAPEIHDGLDEILATIRPRVADDIYYRVRSIRDAIVFTLETARDQDLVDPAHPHGSPDGDDIPARGALDLPGPARPYAEQERIDGAERRTTSARPAVLMDLKVRQVAEDVVKNGSQRLVTHGRFLADRYSSQRAQGPGHRAPAATAPQLVHHSAAVSRSPVAGSSGSACGGHRGVARA